MFAIPLSCGKTVTSEFWIAASGSRPRFDRVTGCHPEPNQPAQASRWDSSRLAAVAARPGALPLIAQITGAVALTALARRSMVVRPGSRPSRSRRKPAPVHRLRDGASRCRGDSRGSPAPASESALRRQPLPTSAPRILNLDVRHSFKNVDLSVTVDGKSAFDTTARRQRQALQGVRQAIRTRLHQDARSRSRRAPRAVRVLIRRGQIRSDARRAVRSRIGIGGRVAESRPISPASRSSPNVLQLARPAPVRPQAAAAAPPPAPPDRAAAVPCAPLPSDPGRHRWSICSSQPARTDHNRRLRRRGGDRIPAVVATSMLIAISRSSWPPTATAFVVQEWLRLAQEAAPATSMTARNRPRVERAVAHAVQRGDRTE